MGIFLKLSRLQGIDSQLFLSFDHKKTSQSTDLEHNTQQKIQLMYQFLHIVGLYAYLLTYLLNYSHWLVKHYNILVCQRKLFEQSVDIWRSYDKILVA